MASKRRLHAFRSEAATVYACLACWWPAPGSACTMASSDKGLARGAAFSERCGMEAAMGFGVWQRALYRGSAQRLAPLASRPPRQLSMTCTFTAKKRLTTPAT